MSASLPHRGRLSRGGALSTMPARSSPLLRTPSTPYDVYRSQQTQQPNNTGTVGTLTSPATPNTSGSVFLDNQSPHTFAAYRRNAAFGSPGGSAARSSPRVNQVTQTGDKSSGTSTSLPNGGLRQDVGQRHRSTRFVRRKSWKQRLQEAPSLWYDRLIFSEYLDFSNPAIGYPLGVILHVLSLLVHLMHPDGALRVRGSTSGRARGSSLFAEQGNLASRRRQQQDSAWRWSANLLIFFILAAVLYNAYHLFISRRRYHLWLKPTDEALQSENAKFVDLPNDLGASHKKPWLEVALETAGHVMHTVTQTIVWLAKRILYRVRLIRYLGAVVRFFFPPSSGRATGQRRSSNSGPQMHALDVWQAPEVSLRIFTLYSPFHLLVYLFHIRKITASNGSGARFYAFVLGLGLMAVVSAQTALFVYLYSGLVKDKTLIAGEVMNEYNQKFVMPRAMPVCRDASTMTTQSETIGPEDLQPLQEHSRGVTSRERSTVNSPRRPKKGRSTAV